MKTHITDDAFRPSTTFRAGRDMPEGAIGWHVDCSDNPLDIRPAVDTILHAIDEKRATLSAGETLVVPVGELHPCPTHKLIFTLLAKKMEERNYNFVVSLEQGHDTWMQFHEFIEIPPGLPPAPRVYEIDPDGTLSLAALLVLAENGIIKPEAAPDSFQTMLKFFHQKNIRTIFSDAATATGKSLFLRHPVPCMDLHDPLTMTSTREHFSKAGVIDRLRFALAHQASPITPDSIAIRNNVMKTLTLEYARRNNASIALLHCGRGHVFGNTAINWPYKHSLDHLFRQEAAVLPVLINNKHTNSGLHTLAEDAHPFLRDSVVIDGVGENSFRINKAGESYEYGSPLTGQSEINFMEKIYLATEGATPSP